MDGGDTDSSNTRKAAEPHTQQGWTRFHGEYVCVRAKSLQSCPTLCNPMGCSLTGSFVSRILQARKLEWVAIPFSRDGTQASYICCIGRRVLYH